MKSYVDEIEKLFDQMEHEDPIKKRPLTENEIKEVCMSLVESHRFDVDYIYDLNDALFYYGYSFRFAIPKQENGKFDYGLYKELMTNTTKSAKKTYQLCLFLENINEPRITLASLYAIKVKFLIEYNFLPEKPYFVDNETCSFRDLYFKAMENDREEISILNKTLINLGVKYVDMDYMQFMLDMEHLLWTIGKKDPKKEYIKTNTIKVAFNIVDKEIFNKDKIYYDLNMSSIDKYLKLIDKDAREKMKNKWKYYKDDWNLGGYNILFNRL